MSLLPTRFFERPARRRNEDTTFDRVPVVVRDAFVPGEQVCGVEVQHALASWTRPRPVFVSVRSVGGGFVSVAVLRFDTRGFGFFRAEIVPAGGPLNAALRGMASCDAGVVSVDDGSRAARRTIDALGVDRLHTRHADEVEAWERANARVVRDADTVGGLRSLARDVVRDGDIIAAEAIADLARADVIALVALGDSRVVVH